MLDRLADFRLALTESITSLASSSCHKEDSLRDDKAALLRRPATAPEFAFCGLGHAEELFTDAVPWPCLGTGGPSEFLDVASAAVLILDWFSASCDLRSPNE